MKVFLAFAAKVSALAKVSGLFRSIFPWPFQPVNFFLEFPWPSHRVSSDFLARVFWPFQPVSLAFSAKVSSAISAKVSLALLANFLGLPDQSQGNYPTYQKYLDILSKQRRHCRMWCLIWDYNICHSFSSFIHINKYNVVKCTCSNFMTDMKKS